MLKGQPTMLKEVARTRNVHLVVLSIGGNDSELSATVEQCASDFMFSSYASQDCCRDDGSVLARFDDLNVMLVKQRLLLAYEAVIDSMTAAGYGPGDWANAVALDLVGADRPVKRWTQSGAAHGSEWVVQIRALFSQGGVFELPGSVYDTDEPFHPNYWGSSPSGTACARPTTTAMSGVGPVASCGTASTPAVSRRCC